MLRCRLVHASTYFSIHAPHALRRLEQPFALNIFPHALEQKANSLLDFLLVDHVWFPSFRKQQKRARRRVGSWGYYKAANSESALGSKFLQTRGRQQAATSNEANQLTATHLHRANRFLLRLIRNHSLLVAVRLLKTLEEVLWSREQPRPKARSGQSCSEWPCTR